MKIAVIGAGAWGTAVGLNLAQRGHEVTLVARDEGRAATLESSGENRAHLKGVAIKGIRVTTPVQAPATADVVIVALPSHAIEVGLAQVATHAPIWISLAKGILLDTLTTPCETLERLHPEGIHILSMSGPSHAGAVAAGQPCAMVLSGADNAVVGGLQEAFSGPQIRLYASSDRRGCELGGALKNAYAVASGVCEGLGLGDNARAGLLTRAIAEMARLGVALGGQRETFYGLTGVGDLMATAYGEWSRNRQLGERVAAGENPQKLVDDGLTAEGYRASKGLLALAAQRKVEAPILAEVVAVLHQGKSPKLALQELMTRPLKGE